MLPSQALGNPQADGHPFSFFFFFFFHFDLSSCKVLHLKLPSLCLYHKYKYEIQTDSVV